jgi:UDP-glucuronate 4-epimerase
VEAAMAYDRSAYEVVNLGNNQTVSLNEMIRTLEEALGVSAILDRQPEQPGDVPQTWADVEKARTLLGYVPKTPLRDGVAKFVEWLTAAERA